MQKKKTQYDCNKKQSKKKQLQQKATKESFILQNAFHSHLSYSQQQQQQLAEEHGKKRETHTHTRTHIEDATREEKKAPPRETKRERGT